MHLPASHNPGGDASEHGEDPPTGTRTLRKIVPLGAATAAAASG